MVTRLPPVRLPPGRFLPGAGRRRGREPGALALVLALTAIVLLGVGCLHLLAVLSA